MNDRKYSVHQNRPGAEYSYSAYGLIFSATLVLPELVAVPSSITPDVRVQRWDQPPRLNPAITQHALSVRVESNEIHYSWKHYGQFLLRGGCTVWYAPVPDAPDDTVRAPLLGVVMGTVLHQRGVFTLHASAVATPEGVVAFVGPKGAGKSTASAGLHQRGYAVVTDDVLAVDVDKKEKPIVRPSFPHLKLCLDAVEALGQNEASLPRLHERVDKRVYAARRGFRNQGLPLKRIYVLDEGPALNVALLSQKESFLQLLSHSYAARFLGTEAAGRAHFFQCQVLAKSVPMYRLTRPRDLSAFPKFLDFVEAHLSAVPAANDLAYQLEDA